MRRFQLISLVVLAIPLSLTAAGAAAADTETFHRFEVNATANYVVVQPCEDGSNATFFVSVIGGFEEEMESGVTTVSDEFLTIRFRGTDCDGVFINDFATGPADFSFSPSLQRASVTGAVTSTRTGSTYAVDMTWEGTGELESSSNTTTFPGFTGHFKSKSRDAVATGTVVVDGETVVDGSTTNAEIETLEDTNISRDG